MGALLSVLSCAFRPGGIDVLLAGMRDQIYKNFEVILVDRLYERRHERVEAMARDYGVKLIHVPEHRRNGKWINFASSWNTAIALARGDGLLFLADYMYAPPGWLEHHAAVLEGRRRWVFGPYVFLSMPELKLKKPFDFEAVWRDWTTAFRCVDESPIMSGEILDEMDVFAGGRFDASWIPKLSEVLPETDLRLGYKNVSGPCPNEGWVHIKNDSVYRSVVYEINGLDERLERGRGPLDMDLQARLQHVGVEQWWEIEAYVYYIDPHHILPTLPYGAVKERLEGRWSWEDGLGYVTNRRAELSLGGSPRAKNKYNIEDLAAHLDPWREVVTLRQTHDVSDEEYWGFIPWPESP